MNKIEFIRTTDNTKDLIDKKYYKKDNYLFILTNINANDSESWVLVDINNGTTWNGIQMAESMAGDLERDGFERFFGKVTINVGV